MSSVDVHFKVGDFPAFVKLMEEVADGCSRIKDESGDPVAVFWADRILSRIEGFENGSYNG